MKHNGVFVKKFGISRDQPGSQIIQATEVDTPNCYHPLNVIVTVPPHSDYHTYMS